MDTSCRVRMWKLRQPLDSRILLSPITWRPAYRTMAIHLIQAITPVIASMQTDGSISMMKGKFIRSLKSPPFILPLTLCLSIIFPNLSSSSTQNQHHRVHDATNTFTNGAEMDDAYVLFYTRDSSSKHQSKLWSLSFLLINYDEKFGAYAVSLIGRH